MLSPIVNAGESKVTLSGHINRAVWYADDGVDTNTSFVDNDVSSSRLLIQGTRALENDLMFGTILELEFPSNFSTDATIDQDKAQEFEVGERKIEAFIDTAAGRLWLGQGDTASNETSENDLSGVTAISKAEMWKMGGALTFRCTNKGDPACDEQGFLTEKGTIGNVFDDFDGLSRQDRIRYDTPNMNGFMLSASAMDGEAWDVAARYDNKFGDLKLKAAVAYAAGRNFKAFKDQVNGSVSVAHSGFSLTLGAGQQTYDIEGREDPLFYYGKVGYELSASPVGATAFAVDYGYTESESLNNDEATTFGAFIVQHFKDVGTELYLGYRLHSLDREVDGKTMNLEDIGVLMSGLRVKF
ncbi:MAG: hypothetical protein BWK79_14435 [Beggiatoa sp. IS2]|nr:MAG: hypothetical protein BWK79_14435 [Beggiatoa sp. IS2]